MTLLRLLRWEMFKLARRRASFLGYGFCALFCTAVLIGFVYSDFPALHRWAGEHGIDPLPLLNGWFYANFVLNIGFFALLPLFAATIAGSQLAGEARDGTLRAMLVRPPSRTAVYVAKGIASYLWLQLMVFFLVGLALLLGRLTLGGGPFLVFIYEFREAGPWILGGHDWVWVFLVASLGAGLSLFAISSLALMLSALTDHPVVAHVGTLGAFFISSALQRLPDDLMSPELRDLLPTRHMNFWHELYRLFHPAAGVFDAARFLSEIGWCAGYSITFLTVGLLVFQRKDITS